MGLLQRFFSNGVHRETAAGGTASSQFHESESTTSESGGSRNAPRRELVQVVMRDTMRKHSIPSDWLECRIFSTVSRSGRPGLHVNFVVRQAHQQLLSYVFAFQDSFESELTRFDSRARDWLVSLAWEFQGQNLSSLVPASNGNGAARPLVAPLVRPTEAGKAAGAPLVDPSAHARAFAPTDDSVDEMPRTDADVQRDLEALFAIRDAAIADAARKSGRPEEPHEPPPDFEPTRPFDETERAKKR